MIGSRLVNCLNKLWQIYPCKYIPRYASGCGNPECKNPKCPGKPDSDPCCCPQPPPPADPCCAPQPEPCCCAPQPPPPPCCPSPNPCPSPPPLPDPGCCPPPPNPCLCPPSPEPTCCPSPQPPKPPCCPKPQPCAPKPPCCPKVSPCPPKPPCCCPKKPPCPPKPPCCPKASPCPPKAPCCRPPPCPKKPPCPPKPPCCPPPPCCPKKPPCPPKPPCGAKKTPCPPKPPCGPKKPSCCPPQPPPCPPPPCCPKKEPPCPCPPKPICKAASKSKSSPSCSKDLSEVDNKARELCMKAIQTCAEARKILDYYRNQKLDTSAIDVNPTKSCQIQSGGDSSSNKQKKKSPSQSSKEKLKSESIKADQQEEHANSADSIPKIYNRASKSTSHASTTCPCAKKVGGGTCNCPHCKNLNKTGQTRHMSRNTSVKCDENCPYRKKVGCVCTCIRGVRCRYKERVDNEFKGKSATGTCPLCKNHGQQCKCNNSQTSDVKTKNDKQTYSQDKKPTDVSNSKLQKGQRNFFPTETTMPNGATVQKSQNPASKSENKIKTPTVQSSRYKSQGLSGKPSGTAFKVTSSPSKTHPQGSNEKVPVTNPKIVCASKTDAKMEGVAHLQRKSSAQIQASDKHKSRIPCIRSVLKKIAGCEAATSKSKSDGTCQVAGTSNSGKPTGARVERSGSESQMACTCKKLQRPYTKKSRSEHKLSPIPSCEKLVGDKAKKCDSTCPLGKDKSRPCTCIKSQKEYVSSETQIRCSKNSKQSGSEHKLFAAKSQPACAKHGDNKSKSFCPFCKQTSKTCTCKHGKKSHGSEHKLSTIKSQVSCEQLAGDKAQKCDSNCPLGKNKSSTCTCFKSQKELVKTQSKSDHKLSSKKTASVCPLCKKANKACTCKHAKKSRGSEHKLATIKSQASCDQLAGDKAKKCDSTCPLGKDSSRPCTCIKSQKELVSGGGQKQTKSEHKLSTKKTSTVCLCCKQGHKACTCKHAKKSHGSEHKLATIKSQVSCEQLVDDKTRKCGSNCPLGKDPSSLCTCIKSQKELVSGGSQKQSKSEHKLSITKASTVCQFCKQANKDCTCKHAKKSHGSEHKLSSVKSQTSQVSKCESTFLLGKDRRSKKQSGSDQKLVKEQSSSSCRLIRTTCPLCKQYEEVCNCLQGQSPILGKSTCPLCKNNEASCTCSLNGPSSKQTRNYSKLTNVPSQISSIKIDQDMSKHKIKKNAKNSESEQKLVTIKSLLSSQRLEKLKQDELSRKASEICTSTMSQKYKDAENQHIKLATTVESEDNSTTLDENCDSYNEDENESSVGFRSGPYKRLSKKYYKLATVESQVSYTQFQNDKKEQTDKEKSDKEKLVTIKSLLSCQIKSMIDAGFCPHCKKINDSCTCNKGQKPISCISLQPYPKLFRSYHKLAPVPSQESTEKQVESIETQQHKPTPIILEETSEKCSEELQTDLPGKKEETCTCFQLKQARVTEQNSKISEQPHNRAQSTSAIGSTNERQKIRCSCCKVNLLSGTDSATPCPKCQKASKACIEFLCKKYKRMQDKSKLSLRASYPCSSVSNPIYRGPQSTILCNQQSIYKVPTTLPQRLGVNFSSVSRFSSNKTQPPCGGSDSACKNQKSKCPQKPEGLRRMPGPCRPPKCKENSCADPPCVIKKPQCDLLCELQNVFRDQTPSECQALNRYYGNCYQNKEYHLYHQNTFHELQMYMQRYRNRQPSSKNTLRKAPCSNYKP